MLLSWSHSMKHIDPKSIWSSTLEWVVYWTRGWDRPPVVLILFGRNILGIVLVGDDVELVAVPNCHPFRIADNRSWYSAYTNYLSNDITLYISFFISRYSQNWMGWIVRFQRSLLLVYEKQRYINNSNSIELAWRAWVHRELGKTVLQYM